MIARARLILKVAALRRVAAGQANEQESRTAARLVAQLIDKYHITDNELRTVEAVDCAPPRRSPPQPRVVIMWWPSATVHWNSGTTTATSTWSMWPGTGSGV